MEREEQHGRTCPADWTWIVPPAASSATPVFHRNYQNFDTTPNFYRHPAPATRTSASFHELPQPAAEMAALCPHRAGEHVPHLRMLEEQVEVEEQTSLLAEQVSCKLHSETSVS
jgi:hypothetical protein